MQTSNNNLMTRRMAIGLVLGSLCASSPAEECDRTRPVSHLAIGNYGMKSLSLESAIQEISAIGFDGFELCAMPGWDSSPDQMMFSRRRSIREKLSETGLRLVAVMEDLPPKVDDTEQHRDNERLKSACSLAHDLSPTQRPFIQTILGNGKWDQVRNLLRDRVGQWVTLACELDACIGIKPHRFGAMSTPEHAVWLINQLGTPERLRIVYDYSHYAYRNLTVEETIEQSSGMIGYVAIKDAIQADGKVAFRLPGETGQINHSQIINGLRSRGYTGDYCCEVSGQVSSKVGYDPVNAARVCFENLHKQFQTPSHQG